MALRSDLFSEEYDDPDRMDEDLGEQDDSQTFSSTEHRGPGESGLDLLRQTRRCLESVARQARVSKYRLLWDTAEVETEVDVIEEITFSNESSSYTRNRSITVTVTGVPIK